MIIVPAFTIVLHQYSLNNNLRIPETVIFFTLFIKIGVLEY